jgi:hypothetical protein
MYPCPCKLPTVNNNTGLVWLCVCVCVCVSVCVCVCVCAYECTHAHVNFRLSTIILGDLVVVPRSDATLRFGEVLSVSAGICQVPVSFSLSGGVRV